MPERGYQDYELAGNTPRQVSEMLSQAVYGDLAGGEVNAAVEAIGRRDLAFLLSGAESTRDRAYKSARDKIRRWQVGTRRPSRAGQAAMQGVARQWRHQQLRRRGSLRITIVATLYISRKRWVNGKMDGTLTGSDLRDFVDALDRGDPVEAANIGIDEYGIDPDQISQIDTIHGITVH